MINGHFGGGCKLLARIFRTHVFDPFGNRVELMEITTPD